MKFQFVTKNVILFFKICDIIIRLSIKYIITYAAPLGLLFIFLLSLRATPWAIYISPFQGLQISPEGTEYFSWGCKPSATLKRFIESPGGMAYIISFFQKSLHHSIRMNLFHIGLPMQQPNLDRQDGNNDLHIRYPKLL